MLFVAVICHCHQCCLLLSPVYVVTIIIVDDTCPEGSFRIVIILTSVHSAPWWEGAGSRAVVRFFKMSFKVQCDFEKGSRNQHFQSNRPFS